MNIQNISTLSNSLQALGFDNTINQELVKNISFKLPNFIINQRITKGNDVINCHLAFEVNGNGDSYSCLYYDAILRKEIEMPDVKIDEIEVKQLDKRMAEIKWRNIFSDNEHKKWEIEDNGTWWEDEKIENIVTDLHDLESLEEGKEIANRLKVKHWCDTPIEEMISNLSSLRSKFEISQRFYFFDGQSGISVEEAHRFLHNRWMEKQLQKKKQMEVSNVDERSNGGAKAGSDKNLLQRKRRSKNNKVKI